MEVTGNYPPKFASALVNQPSIYVNQTSSYALPAVSDPENDAITVSLLTPSPSFASYVAAFNKIIFTPTSVSDIGGPYTVTVEVKDANCAMTYSF